MRGIGTFQTRFTVTCWSFSLCVPTTIQQNLRFDEPATTTVLRARVDFYANTTRRYVRSARSTRSRGRDSPKRRSVTARAVRPPHTAASAVRRAAFRSIVRDAVFRMIYNNYGSARTATQRDNRRSPELPPAAFFRTIDGATQSPEKSVISAAPVWTLTKRPIDSPPAPRDPSLLGPLLSRSFRPPRTSRITAARVRPSVRPNTNRAPQQTCPRPVQIISKRTTSNIRYVVRWFPYRRPRTFKRTAFDHRSNVCVCVHLFCFFFDLRAYITIGLKTVV